MDVLLREQRCSRCSRMTKKIVTFSGRYICADADRGCLAKAIRETGMVPEEAIPAAVKKVRRMFTAPVGAARRSTRG